MPKPPEYRPFTKKIDFGKITIVSTVNHYLDFPDFFKIAEQHFTPIKQTYCLQFAKILLNEEEAHAILKKKKKKYMKKKS